jgi:hypothetical protein
VLLVATVVIGPLVITSREPGSGDLLYALIFSGVFAALGASLLVIPIGHHWDRPQSQRSIVFPIVGSATASAILFFAGAIASEEFLKGNIDADVHKAFGSAIHFAVPVVWLGWMIVFGFMIGLIDPLTLNGRLYKTLLAGSVLELLIAIPMHLVVRRRTECCAGLSTGFGIGVGILVMLIALGPAIFFLFYRRYKQVYAPRREDESEY